MDGYKDLKSQNPYLTVDPWPDEPTLPPPCPLQTGMPSSWSSSLKDELNGVAEAMWKDELSKGIKPKASALICN